METRQDVPSRKESGSVRSLMEVNRELRVSCVWQTVLHLLLPQSAEAVESGNSDGGLQSAMPGAHPAGRRQIQKDQQPALLLGRQSGSPQRELLGCSQSDYDATGKGAVWTLQVSAIATL